MKRVLTIFLLASPWWLAACGSDDETGAEACDPSTVTSLTGNEASGWFVYDESCGDSTCHGADGSGNGTTAADLRDVLPNRTDDDIACIVKAGKGAMPGQAQLSDQDVADAIVYIRATFQ